MLRQEVRVIDGWTSLMTGIGARVSTPPDKPPEKHLETDDELRERVLYVGGDGGQAVARIQRARGPELDAIADELNLKRRYV